MSTIAVRINCRQEVVANSIVGHIVRADGKRICSCYIPEGARLVEHVRYPSRHFHLCQESEAAVLLEIQRLERWISSTQPKGAPHA